MYAEQRLIASHQAVISRPGGHGAIGTPVDPNTEEPEALQLRRP
jgi:hypothetical protein